jgi:hypothetical protein
MGTLAAPLGEAGTTRWADWIELLVPVAVVAAAAAALAAAPRAPAWALFLVAAAFYSVGAGIHLAANSIANGEPSDAAHLWDEVVGHYVWYGGLAGVVAALALAFGDGPRPRTPWPYLVAAAFGLTAFTHAVEGGTAVMGVVTGAVFCTWGVVRGRRAGVLLAVAYGVSLVALVAWGAYWRGFPQFSELGWI